MSAEMWFLALIVSVALAFAGREIACWYWKINEGLVLLRSIDQRLGMLTGSAATHPQSVPTNTVIPLIEGSGPVVCQCCGKEQATHSFNGRPVGPACMMLEQQRRSA